MLRIFHQNYDQFDTSVRTMALDLLLKNHPSPQVLKNILLSCTDQTNVEFSTYVVRAVFDAAISDVSFRYVDSADV